MNEIVEIEAFNIDTTKAINITQGSIEFPEYDSLLKKANALSDFLKTQKVTPENLPTEKKVIAQARKVTTELNARRINIKKYLLEPYDELEKQIKEITSVIDDADSMVRVQIDQMEEADRQQRQEELEKEFDSRLDDYTISKYLPDAFHHWIQPQHLNKSVPIKKTIDEMVAWLEKTQKDIDAILLTPDPVEVMAEYTESLDLNEALILYAQKKALKQSIKQSVATDDSVEPKQVFVVTGVKDIALARALLKDNDINFTEETI